MPLEAECPVVEAAFSLEDFQQRFLDHLYHQQPLTALNLEPTNARAGMAAYRGSLYGGLGKALAEIYPVCCQYVGQTFFSAMADRYIAQHPSTVERLDDYGEGFAAFLTTFTPVAELPELVDLARLEWAWHRAFHSADTPPFDFAAFADACEKHSDNVHFQLAPALTLLTVAHPVDQLWQWHQQEEGQPVAEWTATSLQLAVFRPANAVHIERLNLAQWQFLQQLQCDSRLSVLCEQQAETVAQLLPDAISRGWISGFTLPLA